jgi:Family of unknown function (DUF5519)
MATEEHGFAGRIAAAVTAWPGVTARVHSVGGIEFRLGRRELGHVHGDRLADIPFPKLLRDELMKEGRVRPHHVLPTRAGHRGRSARPRTPTRWSPCCG